MSPRALYEIKPDRLVIYLDGKEAAHIPREWLPNMAERLVTDIVNHMTEAKRAEPK